MSEECDFGGLFPNYPKPRKSELQVCHELRQRFETIMYRYVRAEDEGKSDRDLVQMIFNRWLREQDVEPGDPSR